MHNWTASEAPARIRPITIPEFADRLKARYMPSGERKHETTIRYVRRFSSFLARHPSAKTTADIGPTLIGEYAGSLEELGEYGRIEALAYARRFCNLAVEQGWLRRNPFEKYRIGKLPPRRKPEAPDGGLLDLDQLRSLMAALEAGAGTWKGRRIYTFTSLVIYTGMSPGDVYKLTCGNFAGDMIHVPSRRGGPTSIRIDAELAGILDAWWPVRGQGKPDTFGNLRYGERWADDGKTRIRDEAELAIIAEMQRLRAEGRSFQWIADDLNARGIPTKSRKAKWSPASIHTILKKIGLPDSAKCITTRKPKGEKGSEPDWVFPNICDSGHWTGNTYPGYSALDQLRRAGKAIGIESLTFDRLRRTHEETTKPIRPALILLTADVSTRSDAPLPPAVGPTSAPRDLATGEEKSINQAASISQASPPALVGQPREPNPWDNWDRSICPITIGEDKRVTVFGREKKSLTAARDRTALRLFMDYVESYPKLLEGAYIKSRYGDARGIMRRYRDADPDFFHALKMPLKRGGGGYGIGENTP